MALALVAVLELVVFGVVLREQVVGRRNDSAWPTRLKIIVGFNCQAIKLL